MVPSTAINLLDSYSLWAMGHLESAEYICVERVSAISEMDLELCISRCFLRTNGCLTIVIFALENSTTQPCFKRENLLLKSLEKPKATLISTHGFYVVFFPHQRQNGERSGYTAFLGLHKFLWGSLFCQEKFPWQPYLHTHLIPSPPLICWLV